MKTRIKKGIALSAVAVVLGAGGVYAADDTTNFSQSITGGTVSTFIGDASGNPVSSPAISFSNLQVSNATQTSTGTFGSNAQRIYVDNPGGANDGWTLAIAATGGGTATWTSGSDTYPFNGSTSDDGQLTLDPSAGTMTAEVGTTTGLTKGSSGTFSGGGNTPISLMTAAAGADDVGRVYLTDVSASQTVPASTPVGTYTIDFTQTVTAS